MGCSGCETTLRAFLALASNQEEAWQWLERHGVVRSAARCGSCGGVARLEAARLRFRCRWPQSAAWGRCEYVRSARAGTWCGNSTASVRQILRFCATWLLGGGRRRLAPDTPFSSSTVARWLCYCREVLVGWAVQGARRVGGRGRVVEVEAAPVRRRRLSRFCDVRADWAVAGVERASGRAFLAPLASREDRGAAVVAALRSFVKPGSQVRCSLPLSASQLAALPGLSFRPRSAEAARTWRLVLGRYAPEFHSRSRRLYVGHLAEFLFHRAFPPPQRLHSFFSQVGQLFPPPL